VILRTAILDACLMIRLRCPSSRFFVHELPPSMPPSHQGVSVLTLKVLTVPQRACRCPNAGAVHSYLRSERTQSASENWRRTTSSWATIGGPWGLCWRGRTRGLPAIVCTSIVALVVLQRLTGVTPMVTCLPLGWLLTIGGDRIAVFLDVGVVKLALCRGVLCSL
jgi:hypothetical protein